MSLFYQCWPPGHAQIKQLDHGRRSVSDGLALKFVLTGRTDGLGQRPGEGRSRSGVGAPKVYGEADQSTFRQKFALDDF